MNKIIWLASYPKSGNTWCRVFLTNLKRNADEPADINELDTDGLASDRALFDRIAGIEASDLTPEEIDCLRPDVYRQMASESDDTLFIKIHDAYTFLPDGRPLVPAEVTHGVVYIIRNPLDVAVSFTFHSEDSLETVIRRMGDANYALSDKRGKLSFQLRQKLLTWSGHVCSWLDASGMPVHLIRYEDMARDPEQTFSALARFCDLPAEPERLRNALRFSEFAELQRQEAEKGFLEKSACAPAFFRQGKIGSWREVLTEKQAQKLLDDHHEVMQRFGYLTDDGMLVY